MSDVDYRDVTAANIALVKEGQSPWPSTVLGVNVHPPFCRHCRSVRVLFRGVVEGWYCLDCGASDDDE